MNDSVNLSFIFIIFFLTLGPLKTIPVFYRVTQNATAKFRQTVALRSTLIATAIVFLLTLVGRSILEKWGVSINAMKIAGGLLLLISALEVLAKFSLPNPSEQKPPPPEESANSLAISPIAIPAIITPYGVVAIIVSLASATGNRALEIKIFGLLLLIMLLNWLGMTYAKQIIQRVNLVTLLVIGWVFAVLQAGLAIEVIINALRDLRVIP